MEVQGCGDCGKAVSTTDIEEGGAGDVGGIFFCAACYAKLSAAESRGGDGSLELLTPQTPRQPAPKGRPASRSSRRAKSASRQVRRVSGPQKAVRAPSSARRKAAGSASQAAAKVSASGRARATQAGAAGSSSSRVRRIQGATPTSSGRLQSQSGRYISESGRYSAPRRSNNAVVMLLILVIIGLLGGVIAVLLMRKPPAEGNGTDISQTNGNEGGNAAGTGTETEGTDANAEGTDTNDGGTGTNADDPPPEAGKADEAKTGIQNAIDKREFEKAWQLATKAKEEFPDNAEISAALDGALSNLRSHCQAELDRADELENEDRIEEAGEILAALTDMEFAEFHQKAQTRIDKLQKEEATASATAQSEEAAKKEFLNATIYFNDYLEDTENGTQAAQKALTGFNQLLMKYKKTTFVQKKKELIETAVTVLQGGELPEPDFR